MAAFDAAQPSSLPDTSYIRITPREATKPNILSPTGIAAKEIGQGIEEGSTEINKGVQKYAENVGEKAGEAIQSEFGTAVQTLHDTTFSNSVIPRDNLNPSVDSNGYDTSKVPAPVKSGIDTIKSIRDAREQGGFPGHIRETEYLKSLYMKASELRAQWPGYRDYIDKGIEKATGITPNANAYIKSMLSDLNELYGKKNETSNKINSEFAQYNHIPGVADLRTAFNNGQYTEDQAWHELAKLTAGKGNADLAKWRAEQRTAQVGFDEDAGRAAVNAFVPGAAHTAALGVLQRNFPTAESMDSADDAKWQDVSRQMKLAQLQVRAAADSQFADKKMTDGTYQMGIRNGLRDKYDETVKSGMTEFENWDKLIASGDYSYAKAMKEASEAMQHKNYYSVLKSDTETGKAMRALDIYRHFGANVISMSGIPGYDKKVLDGSELKMLLGNAASGEGLGGITGIKQALGLIDKENKGKSPESNNIHIKSVLDSIMNPNATDQDKDNLAKYMFGPNEKDWLGLIAQDAIDPNGNRVSGRHAVYWQMAKPEFVNQMKQLGGKRYQDYQDWMESTFKRDIIGPDIHNLPNLQMTNGAVISMVHQPGKPIQFDFKTTNGPFEEAWRDRVGTKPSTTEQNIKLSIGNLNMALQSLHNVQGDNANGRFMEMLVNAGVDLRNAPVDSVAHSVLLSITSNKKPESTPSSPTGASKSSGGTNTTLEKKTNVRAPVVLNRINPETNTFGGQAVPRNAWRLEDSPAYKQGFATAKTLMDRLGNVAQDAWVNQYSKFGTEKPGISAEDSAFAHQRDFFKSRPTP